MLCTSHLLRHTHRRNMATRDGGLPPGHVWTPVLLAILPAFGAELRGYETSLEVEHAGTLKIFLAAPHAWGDFLEAVDASGIAFEEAIARSGYAAGGFLTQGPLSSRACYDLCMPVNEAFVTGRPTGHQVEPGVPYFILAADWAPFEIPGTTHVAVFVFTRAMRRAFPSCFSHGDIHYRSGLSIRARPPRTPTDQTCE